MIIVSEKFDYFLLDKGNGEFFIKSRSFNRLYNLNKRRMKHIYGVRGQGKTGRAYLLKKSRNGIVSSTSWNLGMGYILAWYDIVDANTIE